MEWEYACVGASRLPYYHEEPGKIAWTKEKSGGNNLTTVSPTSPSNPGHRVPNEFGLYDMLGLVDEWCLDEYFERPRLSRIVNPVSMAVNHGVGRRVCRGGSYRSPVESATAHQRGSLDIQKYPAGRGFVGFRVVLGLEL
jgi:formylglycine-generating enzyme required for sulfatase activity